MTMLTLPQLQSLLLDLLSPIRPIDPNAVQALGEADWTCMLDMVRQHRLGPLLHWQTTNAHAGLTLPTAVTEELHVSFRNAAIRALVWQRELVLVHRILEQAGIPHVALKGAYLASHVYPHAALRPLRDLDILVPADKTLEAYQIMLDGGLSRNANYSGSPEAQLQIAKHLQPLHSPNKQLSVELHSRLFHPEHQGQAQIDLSEEPLFWQRCQNRKIGNSMVPFVSPTDLLLHLIVHAVFDHQFNNGPLLLSDIAFLLDAETIDWPLFWKMTDQRQHRRGCLLALKLVERYWGEKPISWPDDINADTAALSSWLDTAAVLMLRDFDVRADVMLATEMAHTSSFREKITALWGKLFVPRNQIAAVYPVSENSIWVYLCYPVRWWRLLTQRLPEYFHAKRQEHVANEIRHLVSLEKWLSDTKQ